MFVIVFIYCCSSVNRTKAFEDIFQPFDEVSNKKGEKQKLLFVALMRKNTRLDGMACNKYQHHSTPPVQPATHMHHARTWVTDGGACAYACDKRALAIRAMRTAAGGPTGEVLFGEKL